MPDSERRTASRYFLRIPLRFVPCWSHPADEQSAESMNISNYGVFFVSDFAIGEGQRIRIRMKMPERFFAGLRGECFLIGRVAHLEPVPNRGKFGVGVQFLYFEAAG